MIDLALGGGAAQLVDDHLAEDASALGGFLADIGALDALAQHVELDDRHAARDDVVHALGHRIAGHRRGDAGRAGIDKALRELELALRRTARGFLDLEGHTEIGGGGLGAVHDLLDERIALSVGDKADRDVVRSRGERRETERDGCRARPNR